MCECVYMRSFWIPGVLPGLNEMVGMLTQAKGGRHAWNALKKGHEGTIAKCAREQGFTVEGEFWGYIFVEKSKRRDPSNIMGCALKLIEDSLQGCGLLGGDGWRHVKGICPAFKVDKEAPGIVVLNSTGPLCQADLSGAWEFRDAV